jgi:thioredoxin 1
LIKELMISFFLCVVIGAMMNGVPPAQTPAAENAAPAEQTQTQTQTSSETGEEAATPAGSSNSDIKASDTSDASFDKDVLQANVPVLVDFGASWCQPCQNMAPIMDKLAQQYNGKIKVFKVDTDQNPGLKDKYQINALPTFMVFRGGHSVTLNTGQMPQEMLAGVIDKQLGTQ